MDEAIQITNEAFNNLLNQYQQVINEKFQLEIKVKELTEKLEDAKYKLDNIKVEW